MIEDVSSLIAHFKEMVFIDTIEEYGKDFVVATSTIKETNPFLVENALPSYAFIEIIAQAISALSGIKTKEQGRKIELNLLLGARGFTMYKEALKVGAKVRIEANASLLEDNGFGVYDCQMFEDEFLVAKGVLNVYSPKENLIQKVEDE